MNLRDKARVEVPREGTAAGSPSTCPQGYLPQARDRTRGFEHLVRHPANDPDPRAVVLVHPVPDSDKQDLPV